MLENTPDNRKQALSLLRAGRLGAARAAYEALLPAAPDDADLLGLLAAVALQQGQLREAEELFRRSLARAAEPRVHLRNLHNFGLLLRTTGRGAEACELAVAGAPEWPEGVPADAAERDAVLWLAGTLIGSGEAGKARRLLDRALPDRSGDAAALILEGRLRLEEGDAAGAVEILARAADLAPGDCQAPIALSYALSRSGDGAAARATAHRIARTWPVYADPPGASQRATLLVFNRAPTAVYNPDCDLRRLHFWGNYAAQVSRSMRGEYRFASLFADLPEDAMPERVPVADLVLNNIVNSEEMNDPGRLDMIRARLDRIGLPVINHPDQVFRTTRPKIARLLADIPNLKVPRIEQYQCDRTPAGEIVADIGRRFDYPMIVRKTKAQQSSRSVLAGESKTAVLITGPAALRDHLEHCGWDEFYVVEFVDLKREDGFYRKVRAVIIGREINLVQAAVYRDWMVSGWRSKPAGIVFYRGNPRTIEECNRIVLDPETHLGASAMRILEEIRDRLPLDMFGVDFDVDRDGWMVFFEAGAAMIFHTDFGNEPADLRPPKEPYTRIDDAFRDLVARRIAEGPRGPA